jgi:hypothetical protein
LAAAIGLLALAGGCSRLTDEQPRPGACAPFELIALTPEDRAVGVATDAAAIFTFTDFPEPNSANSSNFGIFSGPYYYTAHESVDLVGRSIHFKTTSSLPTGLEFTLRMSPRVASVRGCPLAPPPPLQDGKVLDNYYFSFRTVEPGVDAPPTQPVPPPATFEQFLAVTTAHCARGCHLATPAAPELPGDCLPAPAGHLSLCAAEAYANLAGVSSRQVSRLAIVAAQDSARSYLLRKLLGAPPLTGHTGPPGDELTEDELRVLQSWIDGGANPSTAAP